MAALNVNVNVGLPDSHRNSPLAPSQELAYRQKCVDLKRRLSEIETHNESMRRRLTRERHFQNKMRLNRAILLDHMRHLVEQPSSTRFDAKKMDMIDREQRSGRRISAVQDANGDVPPSLNDSSEISSGDDGLDSEERLGRVKRGHNNTLRRVTAGQRGQASATTAGLNHHNSSFSHLAPADNTVPTDSGVQQYIEPIPPQPHLVEASQPIGAAPMAVAQAEHTIPPAPAPPPNAPPQLPQPVRPDPPFDQFTAHLIPQMQADNLPESEMRPTIRQTWNSIGEKGQWPWQEKYEKEMRAYERKMDEWKRAHREGSRGSRFVNGAGSQGDGGGGSASGSGSFSAVNR